MRRPRLLLEVVAALLLVWLLVSCSPSTDDTTVESSDSVSASASEPDSKATLAPSTASAPSLPPKLPENPEKMDEFYSPTKNLSCHLDDTDSGEYAFVGCLIDKHNFPDPAIPPDCQGDLMSAVWMDTKDVVTYGMCRGDPFSLPQTTLAYGSATAVGDFACLSEKVGVTCWNVRTNHGFVVSRDSYRVF